MSEEQTMISPPPDASDTERTQIAVAQDYERTQAALTIQCPVCQTNNPPGDRWCQDCGFLLTSQAPEAFELPEASGPRLVLDGREFELRAGANSLGRVAADVLLPDPTVSRHHATLTIDEEGAWIEDVGSTNGTSVNGSPITPGNRTRLYDGDTVKLGSVTVKLLWPSGQAAPAAREEVAAESMETEAGSPAVAYLVAEDGQDSALRLGVTTIGRRSENRIALSGDAYISGRHAEIRCDEGSCVLVDVGSTNGTFLQRTGSDDWERLAAHDPQPLTEGDQVRFGQTSFAFRGAPAVEAVESEASEAAGFPFEEPAEAAADAPLAAYGSEEA